MPGSGRRSPAGSASGKVKRSSSNPSLTSNSRPKDDARSEVSSYVTISSFSGCSTPIAGLIWKGPMKGTKQYEDRDAKKAGFYQPTYIGASCDEYKPRCKKRGYDHPAAQSAINDLLLMPSQLLPVQACRTIDSYQEQKVAAGLTTAKLTQIARCDNVSHTKDNAQRRRQQGITDPITHKVRDASCPVTDAEMDGAAGLASFRKGNGPGAGDAPAVGKSHKGNPITGCGSPMKGPTHGEGKSHDYKTAQQSMEMQNILYGQ